MILLTLLIWIVFIILTIRRAPQPWVRLLPLIGVLPGIIPLVSENLDEGTFSMTEYSLFAASIGLLIVSIGLLWRDRRRAYWGMSAAVLVFFLTLSLPILSARNALPGQLAEIPTPTPGPTPSMNDVARGVYDQVLAVVAGETGLEPDVISQMLDSGEASVADMVRAADGDLEVVIQGITDVMVSAIQNLAAQGRMDENEAAFAISAMQTVVRAGVEFDLAGLMSRFEE